VVGYNLESEMIKLQEVNDIYERFYDGELICIELDNGETLKLTPNIYNFYKTKKSKDHLEYITQFENLYKTSTNQLLINESVIIKNLQENLSEDFKNWYNFDIVINTKDSDKPIINKLESIVNYIVRPPKNNPNITKIFINDAYYITKYILSTYNLDSFEIIDFKILLSKIYYFKSKKREALNVIHELKKTLEKDEELFKYELIDISILEFTIYSELDMLYKKWEVFNKIELYQKL
jgi:hypothetical protein